MHHSPEIEHPDHQAGRTRMAPLFGIRPEDMPDGLGSAIEIVKTRTHSGTHMHAPDHDYPTCGQRAAARIDQMPLDPCIGDGVVLDFHDRPAGYAITAADVQAEPSRVGYELKPRDIVFIRTDADNYFYDDDYLDRSAVMSPQAIRWLIEQGIRVMGSDAWSWDIPLRLQGEVFNQTGNNEGLWAVPESGETWSSTTSNNSVDRARCQGPSTSLPVFSLSR